MAFLSSSLSTIGFFNEASTRVSCSMRKAVEHGDFPWIQELIKQSCQPRYRKIIKILGKEWLSNTRLRRRVYIAKTREDEVLLLESSSKASDVYSNSSVCEIELHSNSDRSKPGSPRWPVLRKKESPYKQLLKQ